jgi:hypothetical protein
MAAGRPAGEKIEVEYTSGVWTDVSIDSMDDPFTIQRGRTSEFSQPSTGQISGLRLKNMNGQYTPLSQVLADGTANANYPNIVPRKRIRYSNTPAGVRGVGYIKGWPPFVDSDGTKWVAVTATDMLDQLSRITLKSPIAQEYGQDSPLGMWSLNDPAGSLIAAPNVGGSLMAPSPAAGTFGVVGPGFGDGTGMNVVTGQAMVATFPKSLAGQGFTLEIWVNVAARPSGTVTLIGSGAFGVQLNMDSSGSVNSVSAPLSLNNWHHVAVTRAFAGTGSLYVDGVLITTALVTNDCDNRVMIGDWLNASVSGLNMNIGYAAIYGQAILSATRIAAHYAAGLGYSGDDTGTRISRYLAAGGLTTADWNLDTGKAIVGTYPQAGKDIVSACQDMATTEGGGSVFYVGTDGKARFTNRAFRKPGAPVMTIDAEADLDASVYAPSFDELTLFNQSTGNRAAQSGTLSSQTYTDPISSALPPTGYGLTTDGSGVTSYATTDADVLALAQARVSANANPGFRLPQVAIDLVTAQNNLYASLANVQIGSRIRVTNLPVAMAPSTQVDLIVEGWTETIGPDTYKVVFDTSPADNPARGVWDDTSYGRWQCSGQTLNANISNSATTLAIATSGTLPTFTTVGARYPLKIQIGQEIITLNSAPGGSTSPQTFTGVTRGVNGTSAAAQTAGAVINLWPAATWTL